MGWADSLSRLDKSVHNTFKMPATYMPKSGGEFDAEVNLRVKEVEVDNGNGGTMFTEMTEAVFSKCDISSVTRGDKFVCRGVNYVITDSSGSSVDTISTFVEKL